MSVKASMQRSLAWSGVKNKPDYQCAIHICRLSDDLASGLWYDYERGAEPWLGLICQGIMILGLV